MARGRVVCLQIGLVLGLAFGCPTVAHADATGETPVQTFKFTFQGAEFNIPGGALFAHSIKGNGRRVDSESAGVEFGARAANEWKFCNWRIDFYYEDLSGKIYDVTKGVTNPGCDYSPSREQRVDRTLPAYGKACAVFYVTAVERAKQCHNIID